MKCLRLHCALESHRSGLTLVELVVVLAILVALAGIVTPRLMSTTETARETAARASLVELRDATSQLWRDCKYEFDLFTGTNRRLLVSDLINQRTEIRGFRPDVALGWNGPYVEATGTYEVSGNYSALYGTDGGPAVLDPWGRSFVIQDPASFIAVGESREIRFLSAGKDGVFTISEATASEDLLSGSADKGDDIYVSLTLR